MAIISGRVDRVVEREITSKFGTAKMYSLQVGGEYYGMGKSRNGVSDGDWVEFVAEKNERGYLDVAKGSLKPIEAPKKEMSPKPSSASSGYAEKATIADVRQDSIIYQSSRKDALEFIALLHTAGFIDYGKAKGADKVAILEAWLDKTTEHFVTEVKQNKPFPSQGATDSPSTRKAVSETDEGPEDQLPF